MNYAVAKLLEFVGEPLHLPGKMNRPFRSQQFRDEKMQKLRLKAPASVVEDYFHLFVNCKTYTFQSN